MDKKNPGSMAAYQSARRAILALLILGLCGALLFGGSLQGDAAHERIEAYGVALIFLGIAGRLWSILYIGGRKSAELVSTGPYSMTRNPLYFFSAIAAAGVGAQSGSLTIAVFSAVFCAIAFHVVALREEKHLSQLLGAPYQRYLRDVPRFFPDPRLYRDVAEVTFQPRILRTTLLDGLVFLVSIPFFELVEGGQDLGVIPVLFSFY